MAKLRIGIVVGEASGDILAEGLMRAIQQSHPDVQFEGIAGPRMKQLGCRALFDSERLAVMGFVEPLKRLPELLSMRKSLIQHFLTNPPDVFIGVDAPDFTLAVERKLKAAGIKTVHYVSPSVWAWRRYRVKKIARSVDLILTLFPFEADFYRQHNVPVKFVGHTLADQIPLEADTVGARKSLGLNETAPIIGLLPGSRAGEVSLLAEPFLQTAKWCLEQNNELHFVMPLASDKTYQIAVEKLEQSGLDKNRITLFRGHSRQLMEASDVLLVASGTATLEALLLKRPMVMAYKLSAWTYFLAKRLVKLPYYSLANLLLGKPLIKEYIQDDVAVERMGQDLLALIDNKEEVSFLQREYNKVHNELRRNASQQAAQAVLDLALVK